MSKLPILLLTEHPPLMPGLSATGLSVRHTRMAQSWVDQGYSVTYAWLGWQSEDSPAADDHAFSLLRLGTRSTARDQLQNWYSQHSDAIIVLGYWEFEPYLPSRLDGPLVLDYVAPRLLERQFENIEALPDDIARLIPLLSRCDEVWVGNRPQHDLMLPFMMMAGHRDIRQLPIRIVPISAPVLPVKPRQTGHTLTLFHGGRDWPWRDSRRWLSVIQNHPALPVQLIDASAASRWRGFDEYLAAFDEIDIVLELADENIERRYSLSFRATDALCRGVPIICNRFLPLAGLVEQYGAGWVMDAPEQLPELLISIQNDRVSLTRAAGGAARLAQAQFDQAGNYHPLAPALQALAAQPRTNVRRPLMDKTTTRSTVSLVSKGRDVVRQGMRWLVQRYANRVVRRRPKPTLSHSAWVVVSRPDLFPTNHGAAVKIERTAWALSFHVDQVILLTDTRSHYWEYQQGLRTRKAFPLWIRVPGWPRRVNRHRLTARGVPDSDAFLYLPLVDRGLHLRLMWIIGRYPVETVQGDFPAYAHPAVWASNMFKTRSLLVEHNVEFLRIAEQVANLSTDAQHWLKRQEVDLANACDRVITVSDRDRDSLIAAGVQDIHVRTIPHGVDLQAFSQAEAVDLHTRYGIPADHRVLVFHGIYRYPPNLEAVEELSQSLLPRLEQAGIVATVLAIGPEPPLVPIAGVVFTGPADDLAGHLKAGDLAVIPLRDGGGTRMKILDDFAAGVPVVSTSKGMEGIPVEHGEHLWIEDDRQAMAEAVVELLNDVEQRKRLSDNAQHWVSQFDWREIARRYVEFVRRPL